MAEQMITKAQMDELLVPMMKLVGIYTKGQGEVSAAHFHVPLTATSSAKVDFSGPVGIEEYDALISHLTLYKKLLPKDTKISGNTVVEDVKIAVEQVWNETHPASATK